MYQKRFDEVLGYLHLADNYNLQESIKLGKVQPFYDMMNKKFIQAFQMEGQLCLEELMIPYDSKHLTKQYIRGKTIKFVIKYGPSTHL